MEQKRKKLRTAAIILGAVLALSLGALVGTLISKGYFRGGSSTVTVPDNLIQIEQPSLRPTLEPETPTEPATETTTAPETSESAEPTEATATERETAAATTSPTTAPTTKPANNGGTSERKAATIELRKGRAEDNTPFKAENLFPGDAETKYYRVCVSYEDKVTVHFHADVRPGYEKLAEVLKARIVLLSDGSTLYDGLMRDMPASVTHKLSSTKRTSDELYYEITAYLDTSVGNDYQNKSLVADFRWWVEETGNLTPPTGYESQLWLWVAIAAASGVACVIVVVACRRRKKEDEHE